MGRPGQALLKAESELGSRARLLFLHTLDVLSILIFRQRGGGAKESEESQPKIN